MLEIRAHRLNSPRKLVKKKEENLNLEPWYCSLAAGFTPCGSAADLPTNQRPC